VRSKKLHFARTNFVTIFTKRIQKFLIKSYVRTYYREFRFMKPRKLILEELKTFKNNDNLFLNRIFFLWTMFE